MQDMISEPSLGGTFTITPDRFADFRGFFVSPVTLARSPNTASTPSAFRIINLCPALYEQFMVCTFRLPQTYNIEDKNEVTNIQLPVLFAKFLTPNAPTKRRILSKLPLL